MSLSSDPAPFYGARERAAIQSDFDSNFPVALSAHEAVIQHGSISDA
jgi:hypothetical protein